MRILVVEDDTLTATALATLLTDQTYVVDRAATGAEARSLIEALTFDLVLLDVVIPDGNGIELCRQWRAAGHQMPILMLTGRNSSHDKATGLDAGADDYVVKPFNPEELAARVRALLRRGGVATQPVLEWGLLRLDPSSCEVTYNGQVLALTPKEYALLELFLRNNRRVFSCGIILEQIWAFEEMPGEEAVRTHMKGLRQKLKAKGAPADLVETVYGIGYRLKPLEGEAEASQSPSSQIAASATAVSLPHGTEATDRSAPTPAEQVRQQTLGAIAKVWQRMQGYVQTQMQTLEAAALATAEGTLTASLWQQAKQEAHSLAGSLGTFGFPEASVQARQLEQWLEAMDLGAAAPTESMLTAVQSLQRAIATPVSPATSGAEEPAGAIAPDPHARLLVVDDDVLVLETLHTLLPPWGIHLTTLADPRQLWETLATTQPNLLILDIEMPHHTGIELCQAVRDHERWGGMPIMILTAHTDAATVNQVFAAGADDFVSKPVVGPELVSRILHRLERVRLWRRFIDAAQAPQTDPTQHPAPGPVLPASPALAPPVSPSEMPASTMPASTGRSSIQAESTEAFPGSMDDGLRQWVDGVKEYAIYRLDAEGTIISWNHGATQIKQYQAAEVIGKPFAYLYSAKEVAEGKPAQDLAIARREGRCEFLGWRQRKDGTYFWGDVLITLISPPPVRANPLTKDPSAGNQAARDQATQDQATQGQAEPGSDSAIQGYAVVTRDITDRKQSDDALQQSRNKLEMRVAERTAELVGVNERLRRELEERKRAQDDLHISQARFAGILDIADDAIISVDRQQNITLFNQGAEKIFGYTNQEVLGQPLGLLLPARFSQSHQDHVQQFGQSQGNARRMGDRRAIYGRRKNGSEFPAEASISKLALDGETLYTVILRDITHRKQVEETLAALSHEKELILNAVGEGICGLDLAGRITFANPSAAALLGYTAAELIGQSIQVLFMAHGSSPVEGSEAQSPLISALTGGTVQAAQRTHFWRKDGGMIPVEYVSTPIQEQTEIVGSVVTFKDITERQLVERMKDEFVSVVSHELRTPLTSIHGALGMLASGLLATNPTTTKRLLDIAVTNTERLVRLINDILDVERIESGQITMQCQPCDAAELVCRAVEVMQPMAERVGVAVEMQAEALAFCADPDRLLQTLTNLLSNAIKFSPPGSTIVVAATTTHNLRRPSQPEPEVKGLGEGGLGEGGDRPILSQPSILFSVTDQGRGIPINKQETIFERFQQVDASDSRNHEGTGLGLAICRNIVQHHGGEIYVESTLGQGSTFYFTIPVQPLAATDASEGRLEPPSPLEPPSSLEPSSSSEPPPPSGVVE